MSFYDDDVPAHIDRCDCGMVNPQERRLLRLKADRTTANGLHDRMSIPEKRATLSHTPVKVASRK